MNKKPIDFLTHRRFDLPAKYIYAWFLENEIKSDWALRLYSEHLKVWNNFYEDNPPRNSLDDFVESFKRILKDTKYNKFDFEKFPVLVNLDFHLRNGSHRWAAAMLYDKNLYYDYYPDTQGGLWDYRFFCKQDYVKGGLEEKYKDAIATEFCKLKNDKVFIATIFPTAKDKEVEILSILNKYCYIIYRKETNLINEGPLNLIKQIYYGENWIGNHNNNFAEARNKAEYCFMIGGPLRIYIIEPKKKNNIIKCKDEIRNIFKVGNHSIHINDSYEETMRIAHSLLNYNSIHFLNHSNTNKRLEKFNRNFEEYKKIIGSREDTCIVSSSILAAYGLRDANDIDYLSKSLSGKYGSFISDHNNQLKYYSHNIDDIIYNPENHFYYDDIKFTSLDIVKKMKEKRCEQKDREDIQRINDM